MMVRFMGVEVIAGAGVPHSSAFFDASDQMAVESDHPDITDNISWSSCICRFILANQAMFSFVRHRPDVSDPLEAY